MPIIEILAEELRRKGVTKELIWEEYGTDWIRRLKQQLCRIF